MTEKEAYRILGILPGTGLHEMKKKYRKLMMQVHPDTGIYARKQFGNSSGSPPARGKYAYSAQEINTAYAVLKESISFGFQAEKQSKKDSRPNRGTRPAWDAPTNPDAYMEREVLQYAEDCDGAVLGNFCVARGKYLWTADEDFPLFLRSLYQCGKQLLDEADASLYRDIPPDYRQRFQAELTYLLAQQFISQTSLLEELTKEEKADADGNRIFYIPAMLESPGKSLSLLPGDPLYPSGIRRHRLYLRNRLRQEAGYLSFPDDRLYYVVIPLFEQKAVRIKVQTAGEQPHGKKKASAAYRNLHLWIKLAGSACAKLPENLNLQIRQLLERYRTGD